MKKLFLTVFLFFTICSFANATDWHVPVPNTTIQSAITAASANDNIIIDSNINSGIINNITTMLNFTSLNALSPSTITMDAARRFYFTTTSTGSTMSDLIFQNAAGNASGGAVYNNGITLTISDSTFNSNRANQTTTGTTTAWVYGGAIYSAGGNTIAQKPEEN